MVVTAGALVFAPAKASQQEPPPTDVRLVAFTVLFEATNQPELGQRLVMRTVINRWRDSGMSVEEVVMQPGQFCAWTPERRLAWLTCEIHNADEACFESLAGDSTRWAYLLQLAQEELMSEVDPPGFEGVKYFDNPKFWPDGLPPWAPSKESLGCVADHCFWR